MSDLGSIVSRVLHTRRATALLAEPLGAEDLVVQSMPDASPVKWHLAHTTWFFERFVLRGLGIPPVDAQYDYLFNSYYEAVGERHPRSARGLLTRPTADEVFAYRRAIDARLADLEGQAAVTSEVAAALELGLNHEQQHQELILTDVKHLFGMNPLRPAYDGGSRTRTRMRRSTSTTTSTRLEGGLVEVGHGGAGFAFDNEGPQHKVYLAPFEIDSQLVTHGEYLAFVRDGGYEKPELWLSEGWAWVHAERRRAPLYWAGEPTQVFTLSGMQPFAEHEPVLHVSYYEADAYARWSSARLPTEAEWEHAARRDVLTDAFGAAWQWTQSAYAPYPGFRPLEGAFGEYNGKFMVSQMVLRGGSSATPAGHSRVTYRNFFPPSTQWQFSGIRLARDA